MKVSRHYKDDSVIIHAEEGNMKFCLKFESERQMRRLGECLVDLARSGGNAVEIGEPASDK